MRENTVTLNSSGIITGPQAKNKMDAAFNAQNGKNLSNVAHQTGEPKQQSGQQELFENIINQYI